MMKIVITGALGHIGSKAIREFPSAFPGAEIVMIDNFSSQRYCSLFNLPAEGRYRFFEGDVLKMNLAPLFAGADAVLHLAALTDAASSFENRKEVETVNYNATVRVGEACGVAGCGLIHLSSTSVYGGERQVMDEDCLEEDLKPQSPYAATKLKEEKFLKTAGESGSLRFVTCRLGTISGVSPGMRFHTAVNKFCWQAVMGQPLTVWRTAFHQKRPYLHLDDAVSAFRFLMENQLFDGAVYNLVTRNWTVKDIVRTIQEHVPAVRVEFVDHAIMNQFSYEVSSNRIQEKGFHFAGSLEKSIAETVSLLRNAHGKG